MKIYPDRKSQEKKHLVPSDYRLSSNNKKKARVIFPEGKTDRIHSNVKKNYTITIDKKRVSNSDIFTTFITLFNGLKREMLN